MNGGTCLSRPVADHCQCPPGYAGKHCEIPCREPSDLVLALDASGSVGKRDYYIMLEAMKELVDNLNVPQSRIGSGVA